MKFHKKPIEFNEKFRVTGGCEPSQKRTRAGETPARAWKPQPRKISAKLINTRTLYLHYPHSCFRFIILLRVFARIKCPPLAINTQRRVVFSVHGGVQERCVVDDDGDGDRCCARKYNKWMFNVLQEFMVHSPKTKVSCSNARMMDCVHFLYLCRAPGRLRVRDAVETRV